ncbi:MAG: ATPase domain-containing protein [Zestosphaera sp.]
MSNDNGFVFGIEGLDSVLKGSLAGGSLIVIAGHPGSGKTTLASTMCYHNALRTHKCLYISLQEDKEKLYRNMQKLGINLEEVEKKNQYRHVKIPIIVSKDTVVEAITDIVNNALRNFDPRVIVIDSITPVFNALSTNIEARAVLQNFFANLARLTDGLVILIAETPLSRNDADLGGLEFVADVILMLTHKIMGRLLLRELRIVKSRGSSVPVTLMTFAIIEGHGIRVYAPPRLEEIPPPNLHRTFRLPCRSLEELGMALHAGEIVYVPSPKPYPLSHILFHLFISAAHNKVKALVVSYESSPKYTWHQVAEVAKNLAGLNLTWEKVAEALKDNVVIVSYNPTAHIPEELFHLSLEIVEKTNPDVVVFVGDTPVGMVVDEDDFLRNHSDLMINHVLYLRRKGLTTVIVGGKHENVRNLLNNIADVIIDFESRDVEGEGVFNLLFSRKGGFPVRLAGECLRDCINDIVNISTEIFTTPDVR